MDVEPVPHYEQQGEAQGQRMDDGEGRGQAEAEAAQPRHPPHRHQQQPPPRIDAGSSSSGSLSETPSLSPSLRSSSSPSAPSTGPAAPQLLSSGLNPSSSSSSSSSSSQPVRSILRPSSGRKRSRSLRWDETNLAVNESEKVPRMKVDEPKTPFHSSSATLSAAAAAAASQPASPPRSPALSAFPSPFTQDSVDTVGQRQAAHCTAVPGSPVRAAAPHRPAALPCSLCQMSSSALDRRQDWDEDEEDEDEEQLQGRHRGAADSGASRAAVPAELEGRRSHHSEQTPALHSRFALDGREEEEEEEEEAEEEKSKDGAKGGFGFQPEGEDAGAAEDAEESAAARHARFEQMRKAHYKMGEALRQHAGQQPDSNHDASS